MMVLLRIFSELGQKRTFEWADEGVEHLEKAVRPLELAKAEEEVKDLEQFPLKSKAEEKEEEAPDRPQATRELAHPRVDHSKAEVPGHFGVLTDVSGGRLAQDDES